MGTDAKPAYRKRILIESFEQSERSLQRLRTWLGNLNNRSPREKFLFLLRNRSVITKNASVHSVHSVLYVIPRIVSATFLFREWAFYPSEEKEKVADVNYCATV